MASMAELENIVAEIGTAMTKSQQVWAKSQEEWAITRKELSASHEEMERVLTEKISGLSEDIKETDRVLTAKILELSDEINKWVGRFGNKIGYLVEMILVPGIKPKVNAYGHNFIISSPRREFSYDDGKRYTEVDLFLESENEVMAVEVKTHLFERDVEYHVERLKLLRENEAKSGLTGKTLYSAVAALTFDHKAREMALNLGMYVVEMIEATKHVNVIKPSGELGKW